MALTIFLTNMQPSPIEKKSKKSANASGLILAGGPGCINPEAFADFFDFFSIGDGCILVKNIVKAIHKLSSQNKKITAQDVFEILEDKKSIYVPELYNFNFTNGRITSIESTTNLSEVVPAFDPPIEYAQASLFSNGTTAVIVPSRGCKNNCGYCLLTSQGYRETNIKTLIKYIDNYIENGIQSFIVNAASSTQYKDISTLLDELSKKIEDAPFPIQVYLGSLCFDELNEEILNKIDRLKAFNHTYSLYTNGKLEKVIALAPEHGSLDLLRCLGRKQNPWDILDVIAKAKNIGIYNYTLYLIVGFLSETPEDRNKIVELAVAVADKIYNECGKITLKINPIIPTPGTACQRMAMPSIKEYKAYLQEIENQIKNRIGEKRFKEQISIVSLPDERLLVESVINRADRRISQIILKILEYRTSNKTIHELDLKKWVKEGKFEWDNLTGEIPLDSILPWQVLKLVNPVREQKILSSLKKRNSNYN